MKKIFTTIFFNCCLMISAFAQTCPVGNGDDIGAAISNGTNHQIYLEWPTAAEALEMRDALKGGALQTAIEITGVINAGTANEEAINDGTLAKTETIIPSGNPFRLRSTVPITITNNGSLTGTVTFFFSTDAGGGSLECVYDAGELSTVAPVELTDLSAKAEQQSVMVSWQTAAEQDNDYMIVERSSNGRDFTEIGKVEGAGTTNEMNNYMLEDVNPISGVNYYRLRQVDFDGSEQLSYVVEATFRSTHKEDLFSVVPSLLKDDSPISVRLRSAENEKFEVEVYSINGQLINSYSTYGASTLEVPTNELNNGMYLVKVSGQNTQATQRFIKNY